MSHKSIRRNQTGFSAVESLLVVIIVLLVGFIGYYVYHANKTTNNTYNTASRVAQQNAAKPTKSTTTSPSYVTIKQWGVRAPYSDGLKYTYVYEAGSYSSGVKITSTKLAAYKGCETAGGDIGRYTANQTPAESDETASQMVADGNGTVKQVGSYYYVFLHDQAECSDDPSPAANSLQAQNNDAVKLMDQNLAAY